jgi:hypothetical protein
MVMYGNLFTHRAMNLIRRGKCFHENSKFEVV